MKQLLPKDFVLLLNFDQKIHTNLSEILPFLQAILQPVLPFASPFVPAVQALILKWLYHPYSNFNCLTGQKQYDITLSHMAGSPERLSSGVRTDIAKYYSRLLFKENESRQNNYYLICRKFENFPQAERFIGNNSSSVSIPSSLAERLGFNRLNWNVAEASPMSLFVIGENSNNT